ncbi:MAG: hypothetical protein OEQ18_12830 [Gammaproteobacteria bacterium]|nr:hypothetical protein [Gammaproteobacteria bacterium]
MCQLEIRTKLLSLTATLSLFVVSAPALADHSVGIETEGAAITVSIPDDTKPGDLGPVRVVVEPVAGAQAPKTIRARVGMPGHGHWIGEEGALAFSAGTIEFAAGKCGDPPVPSAGVMCLPEWFDALFPMEGQYRIRVWLDYADGRTATSAVDFDLESRKPIKLVETQTAAVPHADGAQPHSEHGRHEAHGAEHKH